MTKPWQTSAVHGMRRFLERAWRLVCDDDAAISPRVVDVAPDPQLLRLQHKTVRAVTEGIENLRFNTSIARLIELVNALTPVEQRPRSVVESRESMTRRSNCWMIGPLRCSTLRFRRCTNSD